MIEMTWSMQRDDRGRPVMEATWTTRVTETSVQALPLAS